LKTKVNHLKNPSALFVIANSGELLSQSPKGRFGWIIRDLVLLKDFLGSPMDGIAMFPARGGPTFNLILIRQILHDKLRHGAPTNIS